MVRTHATGDRIHESLVTLGGTILLLMSGLVTYVTHHPVFDTGDVNACSLLFVPHVQPV
jgi:hypothetical protein